MIEMCGNIDLAKESIICENGGNLRVENLYCDIAVVLEILGEIYRSHAAVPELTPNTIPVGK